MGNKDSCFTHMFLSFLYLSPHLSLISLQFPCAFKLLVKLKENSKHENQQRPMEPDALLLFLLDTLDFAERSLRYSSSILRADIKYMLLDCTYLLINHLVFFLCSL